jgi:outer membrane protein OmpA-like peptidoglycan-associated protein
MDYLEEARDDAGKADEAQSVKDDAAYATAFFDKAARLSKERTKNFTSILSAREAAVSAGASSNIKATDKLRSIDSEFIDYTDDFKKDLSAENTAKLQNMYLEAEVMAVQWKKLGVAQKVIKQLKDKKDADDHAPMTYKAANQDVMLANNLIAKNPRNPENYQESVDKALESTVLLKDVMGVIAENGEKTPERAALKIVKQDRQLGNAESNLLALGAVVESQQSEIVNQRSALISQSDQIAFQKAMDNVRKDFSEDEAEVYQQGNKLIIRLKKMNFPVGQSAVPAGSKAIVEKISNIFKDFNAKNIMVQGHTDSTGSKKINEKLSDNRAKNVANILRKNGVNKNVDAKGYGPNMPLADNQTEEGRALNRRVDVVVTAKSVNETNDEMAE